MSDGATERISWAFIRATRADLVGRWRAIHYEAPAVEHRLLWRRTLVVSDPAAVQRVLVDAAENYGRTAVNRRMLALGLGEGLLTSEGDFWKRQRRLVQPSFDPKLLLRHDGLVAEETGLMIERWDECRSARSRAACP